VALVSAVPLQYILVGDRVHLAEVRGCPPDGDQIKLILGKVSYNLGQTKAGRRQCSLHTRISTDIGNDSSLVDL
jgi:hypothetical protein